MSHDQDPGVSMFQGAENLCLEINGKSPEEEEDIEDDNRRKEELHDLLKYAFDDLNTDDDGSVADSSHYTGMSHPHEPSMACENIQPSISPCEVDYKVIEFESRPDESHYCADLQQVSSVSPGKNSGHYNDSSISSATSTRHHDVSSPGHSPGNSGISSSVTTPTRRTRISGRSPKKLAIMAQQGYKLSPREIDQLAQRGQLVQNLSPGAPQTHSDNVCQENSDQNMIKFKQLEKQYQKRVREIEDLRQYIQQMGRKYDADKVRMENMLQAELEDKEKLNVEVQCSEDEKKRVQILQREIQELRDNVNNLVKMKENTNKELDVSRITIYDLQQKIQLLEQKKNVSKSMKSYEGIIEQLKADYEKQEKHYQSVQNKVLTEFDRLKGELEKIRNEKDEMANEMKTSVDFIQNKLLNDQVLDIKELEKSIKELESVDGKEKASGCLSLFKTLKQILHMNQCDVYVQELLKSRSTALSNQSEIIPDSPEPCTTEQHSAQAKVPIEDSPNSNLKEKPPKPSLSSNEKTADPINKSTSKSNKTPADSSKSTDLKSSKPNPNAVKSSTKSTSHNSKTSGSEVKNFECNYPKVISWPARTSSDTDKTKDLAKFNSLLLDRLKERESQLKTMTVEALKMSEARFDYMKAAMNDFVRYHFAKSLSNVSKPPKDTSAETIADLIDKERRKDDLLKDFLDNFRTFISEKRVEKQKHIQEMQGEATGTDKEASTEATTTCTAGEKKDTLDEDEQLLFDLKKMKDSFVNQINHVREELIKLDKENETLRNKCEDYEKKNQSVMEELVTLKDRMGTQSNNEATTSNKKKGKSKNNTNKPNSSTNLSLNESIDSTKTEDPAKLDVNLVQEKNELLKALNRAQNEIKSKESLLQRMECDYYDKLVEIEQHSVDLYAEQVHKIESKQQRLMPQIETFRESLKEQITVIKNQKSEIQELRLRDSVLTMENERLNQKLEELTKKKRTAQEATSEAPAGDANQTEEDSEAAQALDSIEGQVKFKLEYEKLRDVCKQWSDEVRELRHRMSSSEAVLETLRVKYRSIRKSALGYKRLAADKEKKLLEEKEAHKQHLDEIQVKMAKTIHKREAEINAKIAEIEKCNNEKLKVIMMLQRTAENNGKAIINQLNNNTKGGKTKNNKCSNENVNPDVESNVNTSLTNGDVETKNNAASKKNNNSKVNNAGCKVNNLGANNSAKPVGLKKKKTEL